MRIFLPVIVIIALSLIFTERAFSDIKIAVQESGVYQLNVIDNIGNTVHTLSIIVGSGLMFELDLTTQEYVSGNYNVVLANNTGFILNQQFIKIK